MELCNPAATQSGTKLERRQPFTNFHQGDPKMGYSRRSMFAIAAAIAAVALSGAATPASAQKTLRAVMHSDLKILDPIWTTAYIVRNHGYMVYDTLFATDANGEIKPQMVDKHDVSADQLTHTFTPVSYTHLTLPTILRV